MENKFTFRKRLSGMSNTDQLDIVLAYTLSKFAHRAQVRKEIVDGKPVRYFEHLRRVSIILLDLAKIVDRDMIVTALFHDILEDCSPDVTPEMIEHSFGPDVVVMIKALTKVSGEDYHQRLRENNSWKVLLIKACDRLDNLNSLMVQGTSREFQKKQILETKNHYYEMLDRLLTLTPSQHVVSVTRVRDEIRRLITRYETLIEIEENAVK